MMKFKSIVNKIVKFASKNSPYILSGIGATAIATGTILIVKKAKHANETVDKKVSDQIDEAKKNAEAIQLCNGEEFKDNDKKARKTIVNAYVKSTWDYMKYYGPPVILISGGVLSMFSATLIQTKRLKVMSAAYTTLAAAFNEYRDRVKLVVGEEKEKDIFNGVERDEKGEVVKVDPVLKGNAENTQEFSRLFGDGNSVFWEKDTRICLKTLKGAESNLNQLLRYQGFVTLNDVWKELGMRPSEEGMYLGWRWKYGDPVYGGTYIDLGFSGPKNEEKCEELRHSWKEEMWITLVPPHTLFGKLPKEIIRNSDERARISRERRRVGCVE